MITTEIVVLLAFISRFSLDRKNTDLTEEVTQKAAILEANADFEQSIRSLQTNLTSAKQLLSVQSKPVDLISTVETLVPPDVYFTSLNIANNKLSVEAVAGSTNGFAQFLSNLQATKELQNVSVTNIDRTIQTGISFSVSADAQAGQKK